MKDECRRTQVERPQFSGKTPGFGYSVVACMAFLIIVCMGLVIFKVDTVVTALSGLAVVVLSLIHI